MKCFNVFLLLLMFLNSHNFFGMHFISKIKSYKNKIKNIKEKVALKCKVLRHKEPQSLDLEKSNTIGEIHLYGRVFQDIRVLHQKTYEPLL